MVWRGTPKVSAKCSLATSAVSAETVALQAVSNEVRELDVTA